MLENLLTTLSQSILQNWCIAPLLSFLAGILTSFTPCAVGTVSLAVICIACADKREGQSAFAVSLAFALGNGLAFLLLGMAFTYLGQALSLYANYLYIALGFILILMALQIWELYDFLSFSNISKMNQLKGKRGAFILGFTGGVFASPCATPALVVMLSLILVRGSLFWGLVLMLFYAMGTGLIILLIGVSSSKIIHLFQNTTYKKAAKILQLILGGVVLLLSFYMLYLGF